MTQHLLTTALRRKQTRSPTERKRPAGTGSHRLETLEPRLLLAADLAGVVDVEAFLPTAPTPTVDPEQVFAHMESARSAEPASKPIDNAGALEPMDLSGLERLLAGAAATERVSGADPAGGEPKLRELVVVDEGVENYQTLLSDLLSQADDGRQFEVLTLDRRRDGVEQIGAALSDLRNIDAIHVISHGTDGAVQLGNRWLSAGALADDPSAVSVWKQYLTDHADLLFYGCNLAGSEQGEAFIEAIAALSGADVAASDDLTGNRSAGGDWNLEYQVGVIESEVAFGEVAEPVWSGVLGPSTDGGNFRVNSSTDDFQGNSDVAMHSDGSFVVVWQSSEDDLDLDPDDEGIYAQRYDSNGNAVGPEILVNQRTNDDQRDPAVAMDSSGNFVVAWRSDESGDGDIVARMFDNTGTALTGEITVDASSGNQRAPDVAVDSGGRFVVVWHGTRPDLGDSNGVFAQRFDDTGNAVGSTVRVNDTFTSRAQKSATVSMSDAGDFVVAFTDQQGDDERRLAANVFDWRDDDSLVSSGNFTVHSDDDSKSTKPSVAMDGEGNFAIAWRERTDDPVTKEVLVRQYTTTFSEVAVPGASAVSGAVQANTTSSGNQLDAAIALNSDGNFVVSWTSVNQDGSGDGIYLQAFLADGTRNGAELRVNSSISGDQHTSHVTLNNAGQFVVVWEGQGAGDAEGIFGQRYNWPEAVVTNSAPVLDTAASPALNAVAQNAGPPVGAVGTLISDLVDFAGGGGLDNVSDVDTGAVTGIAVTKGSSNNGTWHYSTDGGASWQSLGSVGVNGARLLAADANTRIYFEPDAGFSGTVNNGLHFRAWDQTTGTNGGLGDTTPPGGSSAFSADKATIDIDVTAFNSEPSGSDATVTIAEDTNHVFSTTDFGFTDVDGHSLLAVRLTTIPAAGLTLNGGAVTAGQVVSAVDIAAGKLVFTPTAEASGIGLAVFSFQVQDDGGTANGGIDVDQSPNTLTINVDAVNDEPSGSDATVTLDEDSSHVFAAADFGFSDPVEGDSLLAIRITNLPVPGALTLDGVGVVAGQFVSAADIAANKLVYTPPGGANGSGFTSFNFEVQDDGGTANGGVDLDPSANTLTIDVTSINDEPAGGGGTIAVDEDTDHVFDVSDFGFTDADGDSLAAIRVTTVPVPGTLTLNTVPVVAGQFVSAADIAANKLVYTPPSQTSGAGLASFTFQVRDDGGTANGGVDLDQSPNTLTLDVTAVNDPPTLTAPSAPVLYTAMDPATVLDALSTVSDIDSADLDSGVLTVSIVAGASINDELSILTGGNVTLNGTDVEVSGVTVGSFSGGGAGTDLVITWQAGSTPAATEEVLRQIAFRNTSAVPDLSTRVVEFSLTDGDGGTSNSVQQQVNFAASNNPPGLTLPSAPNDFTENGSAVLVDAAGTVVDIDSLNLDGGTLTVSISSNATVNDSLFIVAGGNVTLNGSDVEVSATTVGTFTGGGSGADLVIDWNTSATPAAVQEVLRQIGFGNSAENPDTSKRLIDFSLTDGDGGTSLTIQQQVNIIAVNDAPDGADNAVTLDEDASHVFSTADFGFTDVVESDSLLEVRISTLPAPGALTLDGAAVSSGQLVSALDIAANKLVYTPPGDASGAGFASFTFQVKDDGGTANGGLDLDQTPDTFTVNVTPVNDAPAGTEGTVTIDEDTAHVFSAADFGFSDAVEGDSLLAVEITTVPSPGSLTLDSLPVIAGQTVSAVDIGLNKLVYTPPSQVNGSAIASLTFQVQDDAGTLDGGVDLDQSPNTLTIDIDSVNDAPAGADKTIVTDEDIDHVFSVADFGFDPGLESDSLLSVRMTTLPLPGSLTLNGSAVVAGQFVDVADINAGDLKYTPPGNVNGAGIASLTFQVRDDGGVANGGVDVDATPNTLTIDVDAVNDEPAGSHNTVTTLEDTDHVFASADFGFSDAEGDGFLSVKISTLPFAGSLTLNGAPLSLGQFVSVADIDSGLLKFSPTVDAHGTDFTSFSFQVRDDGGVANGGVDMDSTANTLIVNVTDVNDAPTGADKQITTDQKTAHTLETADFGFLDSIDHDAFLAVEVSALPKSGQLELGGAPVSQGQLVAVTDIAAGKLVYTPDGATTGVFEFRVRDDGGTANGGVDFDATTRKISFDVLPVNSAPSGADGAVSTTENDTLTLQIADFGFSDGVDGDDLLAVKIVNLPALGDLTLAGAPVAAGQFVTAVDIADGNLVYVPPADVTGSALAGFTFQVQDDGGSAHGGIDLGLKPNQLSIDVNEKTGDPTVTISPPVEQDPAVTIPPPIEQPEPEPVVNDASSTADAPDAEAPLELAPVQVELLGGLGGGVGPLQPLFSFDDSEPPVDNAAQPLLSVGAAREPNESTEPNNQPMDQVIAALTSAISAQLPFVPDDLVDSVRSELEDLRAMTGGSDFLEALNQVRGDAMETPAIVDSTMVGTTTAATTALSVGYIAWLARGGLLLSSFLTSMPAWRLVDPIPVLAYLGEDDEGDGEYSQSLSSLLDSEPQHQDEPTPDAVHESAEPVASPTPESVT